MLHLLERPFGVEEEGAALLNAFCHVVTGDVGGVMACHKVGRVYKIRALYGLFAEAQMAYGEAAGLLGIVGEIALRVHVGMVADYLYGVFVGADGTV